VIWLIEIFYQLDLIIWIAIDPLKCVCATGAGGISPRLSSRDRSRIVLLLWMSASEARRPENIFKFYEQFVERNATAQDALTPRRVGIPL